MKWHLLEKHNADANINQFSNNKMQFNSKKQMTEDGQEKYWSKFKTLIKKKVQSHKSRKRCYDDFFASFMFSYLHLLRRHRRNGMPSDGNVITANAAQSS